MRRLVIMVKEPRPGRVKTRLAAGIGNIRATWWYRHQCRRLFRNLQSPQWQVILAVDPDLAAHRGRDFPVGVTVIPQGGGDLGARMRRIFSRFAPDPTIIVGSDIPAIQRYHIAKAFHALAQRDGVIGPASDGGYWLIGFRGQAARKRDAFKGVRWSTAEARPDTLANLTNLRIAHLDTLDDVDQATDLAP